MSNNLTPQQIFGLHKAGKSLPKEKSKTNGSLLLDNIIVEYNKPFAILQMFKSTKYNWIFPKKRLKIVSV